MECHLHPLDAYCWTARALKTSLMKWSLERRDLVSRWENRGVVGLTLGSSSQWMTGVSKLHLLDHTPPPPLSLNFGGFHLLSDIVVSCQAYQGELKHSWMNVFVCLFVHFLAFQPFLVSALNCDCPFSQSQKILAVTGRREGTLEDAAELWGLQ